jgi:hypothetical protein
LEPTKVRSIDKKTTKKVDIEVNPIEKKVEDKKSISDNSIKINNSQAKSCKI